MNIKQESTGDLTATIQIEFKQEDYQDKVNDSLKDLQKKAALKGFRPGKVPFGLIKKIYEKSVIAEEVNKLLTDKLNNYIVENKLEILGYPLGNEEKNKKIDFENSTDFDFFFDIAFTPDFKLDISEDTTADYYDIQVEDKIVDNYLEDTRRRYGNFIEPETIEPSDWVKGEICQLDESGMIKEGGIKNQTSISLNYIKDDKVKEDFIGRKIGEKIIFNPLKATDNVVEATAILGIPKEESEKADSNYEFTISGISRINPAELNKELFDKVYPGAEINDEIQFREKRASEAKGYYQAESENYFVHTTMEKFLNEADFPLPDEFIKRWLVDSDNQLTPDSVEKDYQVYTRSLKQQMIINKISKDHAIKVDDQEMKDHVKNLFLNRYGLHTENEEKSKQLDSIAESVLKNKEEYKKIYDQLFDDKVRELFKTRLKLNKINVTYSEFINIVNEHHKIHHHEHAE
jgi:trigger factor